MYAIKSTSSIRVRMHMKKLLVFFVYFTKIVINYYLL
jgi:hypothetical protein